MCITRRCILCTEFNLYLKIKYCVNATEQWKFQNHLGVFLVKKARDWLLLVLELRKID